jgi:type I restriction enzyme, S subunit
MSEWIVKTIGEICDLGNGKVQTGPFGSQLHQSDYQTEGYPFVMPKDIINGKIDESSVARVSINHVERLSKHKLSLGDILYGRRGDIGRQALVRNENVGWLCGSGCLRISLGNSPIDPKFFHFYLKLPEVMSWVENQAIGATMPNLNTKILRSVPVRYPTNIHYQRKIVAVVSAYDDLIENNDRRITLLEKMAEEIYREWFVRLRFPGHEQATFHKGIPEGWEIKKLEDVVELAYGKALREEDRISGNYPVFGSGGVVGTHKSYLVKAPGIIIGRKGNVGSVHWSEQDFYPIDTVYYIKSDLSFYFLFFLVQSLNFINNDAAVPGLNRNQAYSNKFYLPPQFLINKYAENAKSIFNNKNNLKRKNELLKQTRDRLLTRLISGKLSVEDLDIQFPPSMTTDP